MRQGLVSDPCFLSELQTESCHILLLMTRRLSLAHPEGRCFCVTHTPNHSAGDKEAGGGAQSAEDDPL